MEVIQNLTNRNRTVATDKVNKYIVVHYVGAISSAKNNGIYFKNEYRGASANYFVDDNEIVQVVKDEDIAWHCGDSGVGEYKNKCYNSNSIGIELCCFNNNGILDISEKTITNSIELIKELMKKYNIPLKNVIRHYDVTKKVCPAPLVNNVARWQDFKNRLAGNEATVQVEVIQDNKGDEIMRIYQNGSTIENIYADVNLTNKIGYLNPYEKCECFGIQKNRAVVLYQVDGSNNFKIGFAKWLGGVQ